MGPNKECPSPIPESEASRYLPEVGAVWSSSPRTDLCGGRPVTGGPTAIMPRGRNWYGPGFWKGPDWYPGAGGFRGGWYERGPGLGPGWGPCRGWFTGPGPYYEAAYSGPETGF